MPACTRRSFSALLGAGLVSAACRPTRSSHSLGGGADVIVLGGPIETLDPTRPTVRALAISGAQVVALGEESDVAPLRTSSTHVVDLQGGMATPGLVDAHAHLVGLGRSLEEIDLRGASSLEEVIARLRAAPSTGGWLLGRGWDQNLWPGQAMPDRAVLDSAFPGRPVWLRRVDGHAGWANTATLRASGIDASTRSPAGGEILRDDEGAPTGVLVDAAMGLVQTPAPTHADLRRQVLAAQRHALEVGLTGVHDMGVDEETDAVYRELARTGELVLPVIGYADEGWFRQMHPTRRPDPVGRASVYALRGVKVYADGALGSRGAALLAPYSDRPDHRGLLQHEPAELDALCGDAAAGGWQVATHAIGDLGNRATLAAYARALPRAGADPRWRIEHCQIVALEDVPRFAELGVIASMQPTHATSDMAWVPARIGDARLPGAYAWRRFLDAGVVLAFGSDFPVELPDVVHGLHAAITRQDAQGRPAGGWLPEQRLEPREAIAAFSTGAARASHQDAHLGRLAPGMRADLTCLDTATPLRTTNIRATIVAGHVLHER